jgi:uncharacterized phage-associated protein
MKLVKLVYIAHGWSMGLGHGPLISEEPQAWQYGPVVPSVYFKFKEFGRDAIPKNEADRILTTSTLTEEQKTLIGEVWEAYKDLTGGQLSTMTHQAGSPWHQVWEGGGKDRRGVAIPDALIEEHYRSLAEETV